jgi:two-component system sensor histidine kinase TctE
MKRIGCPAQGSLLGFLSLWTLGGVLVWMLLFFGIQYALLLAQMGQAQDEALMRSVRQFSQASTDIGTYRVSDPADGRHVAGTLAMEAYPWASKLKTPDSAVLYFSQINGALVRAVVILREDTFSPHKEDSAHVLLQMAAPWHERVPSLQQIFASTLSFQCAVIFALGVLLVIASGLWIAKHWLHQTRQMLDQSLTDQTHAHGAPDEFRVVLSRMRDLHQTQQRWVDEQKKFIDNASHQLRTPMAVLRSQIQSVLADDVSPKQVLPQMLATTQQATHLIEQLLSLSKVEQFKRAGELKPIDLHCAAKSAVMDLSPLIAAKRLDFSLDGEGVLVHADPMLLSELLKNLLTNAIHHTPKNGRLGIDLRNSAAQRGLVIWDEGPGIDDELQDRLFQPFVASASGTGLGLSICLQMAQVMGAHVRLFNRMKDGKTVGVDAVVSWN